MSYINIPSYQSIVSWIQLRTQSSLQWLKTKIPNHKVRMALAAIALLCVLTLLFRGCGSDVNKKQTAQGQPVVLAEVKNSDVPVYLDALGTVTPTSSVTVKTQINGQLLRVLFSEGQMVKTGDLLAEIDARPYEAQLTQYEGQLLRDQALLDNAKIDLKRYQILWEQDSISQQVLATQEALVRQYIGAIQIDKGLIDATRVNLAYCKIISPTNGRVGLRLVDPGNFVQINDASGIAVINNLDPINVVFSIPEDDIAQVLKPLSLNKKIAVLAYDRQQKQLLAKGALLTMDNQIDPSTGTVKLKAQFDNKAQQLFPNQFVNIRLLVDTLEQATVVPSAAIRYKAQEKFVYLKNDDHSVSATPVKLGVTIDDDVTVMDGLSAGEWIVVEGADKLIDGALIRSIKADDKSNHPSQAG